MTIDPETPRVRGFVPTALPWVLGGAMFAVFLLTLSHWVNPFNISDVVDLANWEQGPHSFGPVVYLVTYPLRWLPGRWIPLAFNIFSAFCGSLVLITLARTVSLLPHDRTHEQRERGESEFSILTIRSAWLPPLFAVVVCGLQMTFWEHATMGSSELFNILMFAYVIRCLLEYRISNRESWLTRFALVYGLGMANNWAMIGFFPAFLAALIWIKGLGAFEPRFILRTLCLGLAGFSLIILLPLLNKFTHAAPAGFWQMLHAIFSYDKSILKDFPRDVVAILALTSILPVFVMGIRWSSYFGDNSPLGIFVATSMFHIVHAVFLGACLWVALDSPISARLVGFGFPFLTFYYLGALSVGYLSGYFLLVFGPDKSRNAPHPLLQALRIAVTVSIWLLLVAAPLLLARKNFPHLQATHEAERMFDAYFTQIEQLLPSQGAVVLSDDPFRLAFLRATLVRRGGHSLHLLANTGKLDKEPEYLNFLEHANPGYQLSGPWTNIPPTAPPAQSKVQIVEHLSETHPIYYIHPSFGYYFEKFYPEPHGLVYQLKPYPPNQWDPPALTPPLIAENQAFWKKSFDEVLPPLITYLDKPYHTMPHSPWKRILDKLHLKPEANVLAAPVGTYYARCLDEWGVQLQMAGLKAEAGKCFSQVLQLNTNSIAARINQKVNATLTAEQHLAVQSTQEVEKAMERFNGGWTDLLRMEGPVDEPSFRSDLSVQLANGWNYRQAVQQLNRIRQLAPNDLRVPMQLAHLLMRIQSYTNGLALMLPYTNCYSMALTNLDAVLKYYPDAPTVLSMKSFALMQLRSYDLAIEPMNRILSQTNIPSVQLNRPRAYYKLGNLNAAKSDYEKVSLAAPKAYPAYYGLAEIAYQQKDKPAAIRNYELYLTNAPPNTDEAKTVNERLKELKSGAP